MFLLRDKLITQGEKRETSTKTCNETMLRDKLKVFLSRISPPTVLRCVGCCWLKYDHFQTWANNTQHVATLRNTVAKRTWHFAPNNVALTCCDRLAWALRHAHYFASSSGVFVAVVHVVYDNVLQVWL